MDAKKWFWLIGNSGGGSIDPDAQSLFNRGSFTTDEKTIINETIIALKAQSQWTLIKDLKLYGVSSEANALLDWKNVSYNPSKIGSPTFTAYEGWTGTGSTSNYIRRNFNPNGVMSLNSSLYMAWNLNGLDQAAILFGCQNAANEGVVLLPKSSGNAISRCNSSANDSTAQTGSPIGWWALHRTISASYGLYIVHTLKATIVKVSSSVPNLGIYDLVGNNNGTPGNAGVGQIGASLSADGTADRQVIGDIINDCLVRLNALGL